MSYSCTLTKINIFLINGVKQLHNDFESVRVCYFDIDLGSKLALKQMGTIFLVIILTGHL